MCSCSNHFAENIFTIHCRLCARVWIRSNTLQVRPLRGPQQSARRASHWDRHRHRRFLLERAALDPLGDSAAVWLLPGLQVRA